MKKIAHLRKNYTDKKWLEKKLLELAEVEDSLLEARMFRKRHISPTLLEIYEKEFNRKHKYLKRKMSFISTQLRLLVIGNDINHEYKLEIFLPDEKEHKSLKYIQLKVYDDQTRKKIHDAISEKLSKNQYFLYSDRTHGMSYAVARVVRLDGNNIVFKVLKHEAGLTLRVACEEYKDLKCYVTPDLQTTSHLNQENGTMTISKIDLIGFFLEEK